MLAGLATHLAKVWCGRHAWSAPRGGPSTVAEEQWHASQRVAWEPDGSALFRVTVAVTPELRRWVYRPGREVEVLAPVHPRAWVVAEARGRGRGVTVDVARR